MVEDHYSKTLFHFSVAIMASNEAEVLVVGGGPVGLTLATELSYRGIKTILIEKKLTTTVITKSIAVNARTMEHFRRLGLQEQIEEASYPRDFKVQVSLTTSAIGPMIYSKAFSSWGEVADGVPGATFPSLSQEQLLVLPCFAHSSHWSQF